MKKLFLLLGLVTVIAYPLEVSARDLVKVGQNDAGTYYVWKDSIRKNGNIVWWRDERVLYSANGKLEEHVIADFSGDCKNMTLRLQKSYDQITGEKRLKATELFSAPPESVAYSKLEYVCSSK
jgi:hypothetical protein